TVAQSRWSFSITLHEYLVGLHNILLDVLGKQIQAAHAFAAARLHVLLARAVAVLAGEPLGRVPWPLEEEAPHPGRLELVERLFVAALARLRADVSRRHRLLGRRLLGRCLLPRSLLGGCLLSGRRLRRRLLGGCLLSRRGPGTEQRDEDKRRGRDGQRQDDNPGPDRRGA